MNSSNKLYLSLESIFFIATGFIFVIYLLSLFLVQFHVFQYEQGIFLLPILILTAVILLWKIIIRNISFSLDRMDLLAFALVLLFCAANVFFFHESFAGGRDDGVYANTALYLAKHNTLFIKESFVQTFPGFVKTPSGIISQFYIGYPVWIAIFLRLFGYASINFVNFPLLVIGFLSLYYISKEFDNKRFGVIIIILLSISYPFIWFTRTTFSENLAFSLTWFSIVCFLKGFQNKAMLFYLLSVISGNLLLTVRGESIPQVLLLDGIIVFLTSMHSKKFSVVIFLVGALSLLPTVYYYIFLDPRYIEIFRSLLTNLSTTILHKIRPTGGKTATHSRKDIVSNHQPEFVFWLLQLYNFYFLILMTPLAILKSFKISDTKKKWKLFLIILILLPNFYFLITPSINFDQPWFLRRFMPVILPFSIFCFSFIICTIQKKIQVLGILLILTTSIIISIPIITLKEYSGILAQLKSHIPSNITNKDLLLVDYDNTGHYKLAEPLFFSLNYNSVAVESFSIAKLFGNTEVMNNNLYEGQTFQFDPKNLCTYNNLYVLTTPNEPNIMTNIINSDSITVVKDFTLTYSELTKTCELFRIANQTTFEQMANVDYTAAVNFCNTIPNTIVKQTIKLRLEKINNTVFQSIKKNTCTKNA